VIVRNQLSARLDEGDGGGAGEGDAAVQLEQAI